MVRFRQEIIGDATLIHGDCREFLADLPACFRVDAVITDPPYSANTHKMAKTNQGAGHGRKLVSFDALDDNDFRDVTNRCLNVPTGWVVMTCDYRHAALLYAAPEFVRLGVWVKPNPMPQISADRPGQGFEAVAILHAGERPKVWNRGGGAGVWTFPVTNGAEVPTQKPLALASAFVADFTQPGETVCDPFAGSGTTGVACLLTGRKFLGIEASLTHFDVAARRLEAAHAQPRLFEEPPPKPVQTSLLEALVEGDR
jgi:site-specific DNA-methyltransferase (adenine-specific)